MLKKIAIIGGSGLDDPQLLQDYQEIILDTPYGSPSGPLISGVIAGAEVVFLSRHGRGHTIMPTKVPYRANIWALKEMGCTHVIATTACGSLQENIKPRDFVILDQFIDFTKHRNATFFEDKVVHTPMADPFDEDLRNVIIGSAQAIGLLFHERGTMLTIEGPRFSTRAESCYFKHAGADVINMSTVPEVVLAKEIGLPYASIAMATDYDSWREGEAAVTWEMILEVMKDNSENAKRLLLDILPRIGR